MNHIERVVVDEGVGRDSELMAQFRDRLGDRKVVFVFLASEHPGIPDIEILDKLLDGRSVLLTQDRVLHNLAIGRGFQSMTTIPDSGLTDRRLAHVPCRTDIFLSQAAPSATITSRKQTRKRAP